MVGDVTGYHVRTLGLDMDSSPAPLTARQTFHRYFSDLLFVAMHLSVLLVFAVHFSWSLVAMALGAYLLRMGAITAGYHRYFAHRAYKTSRAFQLVLAVLGTTAMQNGPLWWASVHRRHHKHSDTPQDPHSPARRGLWYAHVGWIFDRTRSPADYANVGDLSSYRELRFLDRHEWLPIVGYAFTCFAIAGLPGVVWGFCVSTIAVLHGTMLINSLAHVWGRRRYETDDDSRNNGVLAVVTLGEGWHNNHHHYASSARQGFMWWEIDVTYYAIRALAACGVVWDVREPPAFIVAGGRQPRLAERFVG